MNAEGLVLKFQANGHVRLSGKDRWGNEYDTTYENQKFLLEALPVLERSFGEKQTKALRRVLDPSSPETGQ